MHKYKNLLIITLTCVYPTSQAIAHASETQPDLQFDGQIQYDVGKVSDGVNKETQKKPRRIRLGAKYKFTRDIRSRLSYELGGKTPKLKDAYIEYRGISDTRIKIGQTMVSSGLENMTSSSQLPLVERSLPTALLSAYKTGVQVNKWGDDYSLNVDIKGGSASSISDLGSHISQGQTWNLRATKALELSEDNLLHIGGSFSYNKPYQNSIRFRAKPESQLVNNIVDTKKLDNVDYYSTEGLEVAWQKDKLLWQNEYMQTDIHYKENQQQLSGWYSTLAYMLQGKPRKYKPRTATFNIQKNKKNDDNKIELVARFSQLNLQDGELQGGKATSRTVGANYYLDNNTRFMLNYGKTIASPDKKGREKADNILQARIQLSFF